MNERITFNLTDPFARAEEAALARDQFMDGLAWGEVIERFSLDASGNTISGIIDTPTGIGWAPIACRLPTREQKCESNSNAG